MSFPYVHGSANPGTADPAEERRRLAIRNLTAAGGPGKAIRDVCLDVRGGEILAIVGPSGSGKSRLIRLLAGLEAPDSGTVALDGRNLTSQPPRKRGFGVVFQEGSLFRRLTVEENVAFGLRARRLKGKEVSRRVEWMLKRFELDEMRRALPHDLSGGQRRKAELARALVWEPNTVLLDDPFKTMDAVSRMRLRQVLRSLVKSFHAPTLLVTHDQEEALELGDRVAVFRDGRIEQIGSPFELYLHPANEFVAAFFGAANSVLGRWGGGSVHVGGLTLDAPANCSGFIERQPVRIVFRPEDVAVNFSAQLLDCPHLLGDGVVEDVFYVGATERLGVRLLRFFGDSADDRPTSHLRLVEKDRANMVPITVVRSKREVEELEVAPGDSVVVGLRTFQVLPHYPLASDPG